MDQFGFIEGDEMGESDHWQADAANHVRDDRPAALLVSDGASTTGALIAAGGCRLLEQVGIAKAAERLERQVQVDIVVVECRNPHPALPALLARLNALAAAGDMAVIMMSGLACLDDAYAALTSTSVQLLCDAGPFDLAAALAVTLQQHRAQIPTFHDIGRESEHARIERLSQEVGRLARVLDALTQDGGGYADLRPAPPSPSLLPPPHMADRASRFSSEAAQPLHPPPGTAIAPGQVRDLLRARRLRDQFFPPDLFADPAWDMMLDLMCAQLTGERVSVSSLCIAAAVPPTTALRWIKQLTDRGLFLRQADPADGRRIFITLSQEAQAAVAGWFSASRRMLRDALT